MTERPQLNDIDSPFPAFALGDEGLNLSDLPGKLQLRKTGPFARFTEGLEKDSNESSGWISPLRPPNAMESGYKPKIE